MAESPVEWRVDGTGIREDTTLHPAGNGLLHQWIVPYVITSGPAKGTRQEVRVSPEDFTAAGVKQAIAEHVNNVHHVAGLTHAHA